MFLSNSINNKSTKQSILDYYNQIILDEDNTFSAMKKSAALRLVGNQLGARTDIPVDDPNKKEKPRQSAALTKLKQDLLKKK